MGQKGAYKEGLFISRFDRIVLRPGSDSGSFPVRFDELRVGLSWEAVLPLRG